MLKIPRQARDDRPKWHVRDDEQRICTKDMRREHVRDYAQRICTESMHRGYAQMACTRWYTEVDGRNPYSSTSPS